MSDELEAENARLRAELAAANTRADEAVKDRHDYEYTNQTLRAELADERERYAFLAQTNENLRRNMEANAQFWRSSERDALREALREARPYVVYTRNSPYKNDHIEANKTLARIDAILKN